MFVIKLLSKIVGVLRSGDTPNQIAWGFAVGTILGMTPFGLCSLLLWILLVFLHINLTSAILGFFLYKLIASILAPLFHMVGYDLLVQIPFLIPLWTSLYNAPIAPLTQFNQTVAMGSRAIAVVLFGPHFFLFRWIVRRYRETWEAAIQKWKIVQLVKGSRLVRAYVKIRDWGG